MICILKLAKLNSSMYCYVSLTIQLSLSYLFTQLNDQIVLFQGIPFSMTQLFALSLNVRQLIHILIHIEFPNRGFYHGRKDLGAMTMNVYYAFPKAPTLLELRHQIV